AREEHLARERRHVMDMTRAARRIAAHGNDRAQREHRAQAGGAAGSAVQRERMPAEIPDDLLLVVVADGVLDADPAARRAARIEHEDAHRSRTRFHRGFQLLHIPRDVAHCAARKRIALIAPGNRKKGVRQACMHLFPVSSWGRSALWYTYNRLRSRRADAGPRPAKAVWPTREVSPCRSVLPGTETTQGAKSVLPP